MTKALFLDRDGTINVDYGYVHEPEKFVFIDGVFDFCRMAQENGYLIIVVTNQSGVARGLFTEDTVRKLHDWMAEEVRKAAGEIAAFYYCPHLPGAIVKRYDVNCECRKPKPGMILKALGDFNVQPGNAFLIGDSPRDVEAAEAAGVKGYLYTGGSLLDFVKKIMQDMGSYGI